MYNPATCPVCAAAVATFLHLPYVTGIEPQHQLIRRHWQNTQKLANKHGVLACWTNPDLPFLIGLGHPA